MIALKYPITYALLFLLLWETAWAQGSISGSIKEENGMPIPYAAIALYKTKDSSLVAEGRRR